MAKILVLGDLHCPAENQKALDLAKRVYKEFKCDRVLSTGDEVDFHAFSRFGSDPDMPSPGSELELAVEALEPWCRAFPQVDICGSNHTARIFRKCISMGIPEKVRRRMTEILKMPSEWIS